MLLAVAIHATAFQTRVWWKRYLPAVTSMSANAMFVFTPSMSEVWGEMSLIMERLFERVRKEKMTKTQREANDEAKRQKWYKMTYILWEFLRRCCLHLNAIVNEPSFFFVFFMPELSLWMRHYIFFFFQRPILFHHPRRDWRNGGGSVNAATQCAQMLRRLRVVCNVTTAGRCACEMRHDEGPVRA